MVDVKEVVLDVAVVSLRRGERARCAMCVRVGCASGRGVRLSGVGTGRGRLRLGADGVGQGGNGTGRGGTTPVGKHTT